MPNYDFGTLSPIDFENLVRDLVQAKFKILLESFKSGPDQGIDFRYCPATDKTLIVQCKHYIESGYKVLKREIEENEAKKLKKLDPDRYIFATSLGLNPSQKNEIYSTFDPYIKGEGDILGRDDLNNLLSLHPDIEKKNFKLWLTSIDMFEEILNAQVKNVSREALEAIRNQAKYYVQNESFDEAMKILDKHNVCIIAGIPGIGKTTLAEMLALYYVTSKYELIRITSDISEASSVDYHNKKRVFYYDDFLGQTPLSMKLNKNEDQSLLNFIQTIKRSKGSKLILTTREYILNQAKLSHEKINRADFKIQTCVIDLKKYSRMNRAKILFNHIYFSDIPNAFKRNILKDHSYLKIIDHKNYNPRIIELMTEYSRIHEIKPDDYGEYFVNTLENPMDIWRHAFENQIFPPSRILLMTLACMPREVFVEDLEKAFNSFYADQCEEFNLNQEPDCFRRGLQELEGNFIKFERSEDNVLVEFHNPSIRDFIHNYLIQNRRYYVSLVKSAVFFDQVLSIRRFRDNSEIARKFRQIIKDHFQVFENSIIRTFSSDDCQIINRRYLGESFTRKVRWRHSFEERAIHFCYFVESLGKENAYGIFAYMQRIIVDLITARQVDKEKLARFLIAVKKNGLENHLDKEIIRSAIDVFVEGLDWLPDYEAIGDLIEEWPEIIPSEVKEKIGSDLKFNLPDPFDETDPETIRSEADTIHALGEIFDLDFSEEVDEFENHAKQLEEEAGPPEEDYAYSGASSFSEECTDEQITSILAL